MFNDLDFVEQHVPELVTLLKSTLPVPILGWGTIPSSFTHTIYLAYKGLRYENTISHLEIWVCRNGSLLCYGFPNAAVPLFDSWANATAEKHRQITRTTKIKQELLQRELINTRSCTELTL